jgi:ribonuclease P/MRP protein subunit POP5
MKHLPKHLRPRYRYLGVAIESTPDAVIDRGDFQREVWYAAQNLLGDAGSAKADLTVHGFEFEAGSGAGVVRTSRGEEGPARAVLATVTEINGAPVGVFVRGISGTVRACEEKYIHRPQIATKERTVAFGNADRRAVARGERLDVRVDSRFVGATELDTA